MRRGSWKLAVLGLAGGFSLAAACPLAAQQTARQLVIFRVLPARHATVAPLSEPMSLHATQATVTHTSWSIVTNQSAQKITVALDRPLPSGSRLLVALGAPAGAASAGEIPLNTVATDVLTDIPVTAESGLPVRYTLQGSGSTSDGGAERMVVYTVVVQP